MKKIIKSILNPENEVKTSGILSKNKKIIKVLFFMGLVLMVISLFISSKLFTTTALLANTILVGSYMIIEKYHFIFDLLLQKNKIAKSINKTLGVLNG